MGRPRATGIKAAGGQARCLRFTVRLRACPRAQGQTRRRSATRSAFRGHSERFQEPPSPLPTCFPPPSVGYRFPGGQPRSCHTWPESMTRSHALPNQWTSIPSFSELPQKPAHGRASGAGMRKACRGLVKKVFVLEPAPLSIFGVVFRRNHGYAIDFRRVWAARFLARRPGRGRAFRGWRDGRAIDLLLRRNPARVIGLDNDRKGTLT